MAVDGDDVLVGEPILGSRNAHRPLSLNVGKNQGVTPRAVRNSRKPDVFIPASQSNRDRDASHTCFSTFLGFDSTVDSQLAFVGLKRLLFLVAIHCIPVIASPSLNQHQQVRCLAVLCIVALKVVLRISDISPNVTSQQHPRLDVPSSAVHHTTGIHRREGERGVGGGCNVH